MRNPPVANFWLWAWRVVTCDAVFDYLVVVGVIYVALEHHYNNITRHQTSVCRTHRSGGLWPLAVEAIEQA